MSFQFEEDDAGNVIGFDVIGATFQEHECEAMFMGSGAKPPAGHSGSFSCPPIIAAPGHDIEVVHVRGPVPVAGYAAVGAEYSPDLVLQKIGKLGFAATEQECIAKGRDTLNSSTLPNGLHGMILCIALPRIRATSSFTPAPHDPAVPTNPESFQESTNNVSSVRALSSR